MQMLELSNSICAFSGVIPDIGHQCRVFFSWLNRFLLADMASEATAGTAPLSSEDLAAVEDEEVLNAMVS